MSKTYEVTSPDGKTFEVTAPDDATPDQVLAYAQEQFKSAPAAPGIGEKIVSALKQAHQLTPTGMAMEGMKSANEAIESGAYAAGGAVTDATGSPAAGFAANVGLQAIPVLIGTGVGGAATKGLQSAGRSMMMSALKPTKAEMKSGDAARVAETMLEKGKNVTAGGVQSMRDRVGVLNDELQTALNASPATVDKSAIASRLQEVIAKIEVSSFTPQQRVKAVEKIYNDVLGNTSIPNLIPVALANKIKSGIYKELGDQKYSRMRTGAPISDAEQAQAALAKGAKEEISKAVPIAAPANAEMSQLIKAADMAENQVLAFSKTNPGGLAWLTHDLPNFIAMLTARHPATKSIIARALYSPKTGPGAGGAVGGAVGMYSGQEKE